MKDFGVDIICSFEENSAIWEKIKFADNAVSPVHVRTGIATCQVMQGQFEVNIEEDSYFKIGVYYPFIYFLWRKQKALILKHDTG